VRTYVVALLATIGIEFVVLWFMTRRPVLAVLFYSILMNCLTQPVATWFYQTSIRSLWLVEVIVVVVESILIWLLMRVRYPKAVLTSLLANLASALIGVAWFGVRS